MIEKTRLSLWDFFVLIVSGYAIMLNILAHCLFRSLITWDVFLSTPTGLVAVAALPSVILAGLLFEPLANHITKLLTTYPWRYIRALSFKEWDNNLRTIQDEACRHVPKGIKGSTYEYCKNCVCQNTSDDSYMPFLAKFGFYRSMFVLLLLNAISIPFIYEFGTSKTIGISLSLGLLALLYLRRSGEFYRHISSTIYLRFVSSCKAKAVDSSGK